MTIGVVVLLFDAPVYHLDLNTGKLVVFYCTHKFIFKEVGGPSIHFHYQKPRSLGNRGIQEKKDREEKEEDERIVISINTAREEVPSRDETDSKICRDIHYQRYSTCIGQPKVLNDALFKLVRKGDD
ncbi:hypothetical protein RCL_jg21524.t2 [Rhizophagus clarus]|uniref:Uncharacterized protein n=1 Tax=Rhizophagus clarus TaxID=94130 RepID=A0A8H3QGY1_9GLOM|nr:hypothetical protein RCL_jg21524.t2 [Rhizophagus clarus]